MQTSGEPSLLGLSRVQPEITSEVSNYRSEELKHSEELATNNENKGEILNNKGEQINEEENITPNS